MKRTEFIGQLTALFVVLCTGGLTALKEAISKYRGASIVNITPGRIHMEVGYWDTAHDAMMTDYLLMCEEPPHVLSRITLSEWGLEIENETFVTAIPKITTIFD